jgi:glyoxylase-like metal-dependent hydrolase (beta-lactamase superfamily II)
MQGDRSFTCDYGVIGPVTPLIRRIVARNPGPFTFRGTGTYVVGHGKVAVIDPGPDLAEHVDALLAALGGETITHIVVTHTHRDHSPAAAAVKKATGAPTYGFGPHGAGGELVEAGGDMDFVPDIVMKDGEAVEAPDWRLEAIHTPGHTSNHLCFTLPQERALFSGDHVMGWSTTVIAPPDGDMADYMRSLDRLRGRDHAVYWRPTARRSRRRSRICVH